jgi:hypothetical protein
MLPKTITFDEYFEETGEPRCQILDLRDRHLYKYASSDVMDYASTITTEPGFTNVLVLAMSASEYYGPNRNGDAFAEKPVKVNGQWAVAPGETLPEHHSSFERRAHVYRHHINKDPAKSMGGVRKSFYNHKMHRVELFLRVSHSAGQDIVDRIDAGDYPAVSMGCRIKYDVCNHCGNRAPTRAQYCEHVNGTNPKYGMNRLMPDGERHFVWNPAPDLFDISFVFKPADRIGFMMKKVAYIYDVRTSADLGAEEQDISEKRSALQKVSDIEKVVAGDVVDPRSTPSLDAAEVNAVNHTTKILSPWKSGIPTLSVRALSSVGGCSAPQLASSMFAIGMLPTVVELFRLICMLKGLPSDPDIEQRLSYSQGKVAAALRVAPQILTAIERAGLVKLSHEYIRRDLIDLTSPMQEKRALYKDYLARRYVPESVGGLAEQSGIATLLPGDENMSATNAYYSETNQPLHWQDDKTGKTYQTTRRAGEKADWSNRKKEMAEAAGLAAVTGIGYKALSGRHPVLAAPALLGGAWGVTDTLTKQRTPTVETLEGVKVPVNTEFVEKRASGLRNVGIPIAGGALTTALLTQDMVGAPSEITRMYQDNPSAGWLANTTALAGLMALHPSSVAASVRNHIPDLTPIISKFANATVDEVDLEDAIQAIGEALMR